MTDVLPPLPLLLAFFTASLILAVTPGPGVLYIVARSVAEGRAAGLASVLGVALGNLGSAVGASLGLVVVLSASSVAFDIVRYVGALYLFFLAWKALRRPRPDSQGHVSASGGRNRRVVWDGFVVALLNPKTALFFAAFLPQFMAPGVTNAVQPLLLAIAFVVTAAVTDTLYALSASTVAGRVSRLKAARFLAAGTYFGIGLLTALFGSR